MDTPESFVAVEGSISCSSPAGPPTFRTLLSLKTRELLRSVNQLSSQVLLDRLLIHKGMGNAPTGISSAFPSVSSKSKYSSSNPPTSSNRFFVSVSLCVSKRAAVSGWDSISPTALCTDFASLERMISGFRARALRFRRTVIGVLFFVIAPFL